MTVKSDSKLVFGIVVVVLFVAVLGGRMLPPPSAEVVTPSETIDYAALNAARNAAIEAQWERDRNRWRYSETTDPMAKGKTFHASVRSRNAFSLSFPYEGEQHGYLQLRRSPRHGDDVIFSIEKGQFAGSCSVFDCEIAIRFGEGKVQMFRADPPADNSTTTLFIRGYDRFVAQLLKVNTVTIAAVLFQEGEKALEFEVSGLQTSKLAAGR